MSASELVNAALAYADVHAEPTPHATLMRVAGFLWNEQQGLACKEDFETVLLEVNRRSVRRPESDVHGMVRWLAKRPRGDRGRSAGRTRIRDPLVEQLLTDARSAIAARSWKGRGGKTDRAVTEAHLLIADTWHSPLHEGAERLVALLAGVNRRSVRRAHCRLIKAGWLDPLRTHAGKHGRLWRLQIPGAPAADEANEETAQTAPIQRDAQGADWGFMSGLSVGALAHPLFREGQGGLGKSVGALLVTLDHHGPVKTQTEWARLADSSTVTIRRWEKGLLGFGLIVKAGRRGYVRGPASYDDVAKRLRLDELARREKQHYARETAEYRHRVETSQRHQQNALAASMLEITSRARGRLREARGVVDRWGAAA